MNRNVLLIKVVLDFLNRLEDSQIEDLLDKKACLKLESCHQKEIVTQRVEESPIDVICKTLEEKDTRDAAREYLMELNLNKSVLKLLIKHYKIPLTSKATNAQMMNEIIEAAVGVKIRYNALYNTNLNE